MDDFANVGSIRSTITLCSDVEISVLQAVVLGEEELEECVNILSSDGRSVDGGAIRGIGKADVGGLVEEDDVGVVCPAVGVVFDIRERIGFILVVANRAWAEFEEETSRG